MCGGAGIAPVRALNGRLYFCEELNDRTLLGDFSTVLELAAGGLIGISLSKLRLAWS